jgi:tetratricopeptide (TPR) repeat protein
MPLTCTGLTRLPRRSCLTLAALGLWAGLGAGTATAAAPLDCAACREVCRNRSYPDNARPDLRSGGLLHRSPEARAAFESGVAADPGLGGTDARRAVDAYKNAVLIDPDNAQYRNHLAAALLTSGVYPEAIYNLEKAAALIPTEPKYIVNLGYAWHRAGDEQRALVWYMRALIIDPGDGRARLFAGYALELLGMPTEATLEFRRVLLQDPGNVGARTALARLGKPVPAFTSPPMLEDPAGPTAPPMPANPRP